MDGPFRITIKGRVAFLANQQADKSGITPREYIERLLGLHAAVMSMGDPQCNAILADLGLEVKP